VVPRRAQRHRELCPRTQSPSGQCPQGLRHPEKALGSAPGARAPSPHLVPVRQFQRFGHPGSCLACPPAPTPTCWESPRGLPGWGLVRPECGWGAGEVGGVGVLMVETGGWGSPRLPFSSSSSGALLTPTWGLESPPLPAWPGGRPGPSLGLRTPPRRSIFP
jgi:hypothetical protein